LPINNWFDLFFFTIFIVFMCFGIGIIGTIYMILKVLRSQGEMNFAWGGLFEKTPPFVQNNLQTLVTSVLGLLGIAYVLFVMGWFYKYVDAVKVFWNQ